MRIVILSILLSILCPIYAFAQNVASEGSVVIELDNWKVFDRSEEVNVPYLLAYHSDYTSVFQDIELSEYRNLNLQLISDTDGSVFLNDRLIYSNITPDDTLTLSIDELIEINNDLVLTRITFYSKSIGFWTPPKLRIVSYLKPFSGFVDNNSQVAILSARQKDSLTSSNTVAYLIGLWLVFSFYIYLFQKNYSFGKLISAWLVWLRFRVEEEDIPIIEVLIFSIIYAFSIEFFLSICDSNLFDEIDKVTVIKGLATENTTINKHFLIASLIALWLFTRFILVGTMAALFQIKQLSVYYLRDWYRLSLGYTLIILLISSVYYFTGNPINFNIQIIFWISLLFKAILVTTNTNRAFKLQKVYLFSYFCTTELVPILLGMKLFIDF